jgi:hypothetical protein
VVGRTPTNGSVAAAVVRQRRRVELDVRGTADSFLGLCHRQNPWVAPSWDGCCMACGESNAIHLAQANIIWQSER